MNTGIQSGANESGIKVAANNLTVPWGIAFLPQGDILVTERSGTLRRIGENQKVYQIDGVEHVGEGGLLGIALHPDFETNKLLYLYLTTNSGGTLTNRIERYVFSDDKLSQKTAILQNIPGEVNHDGGRLAFGPDGYLYATSGDAGKPDLSQDISSLAGKILRLDSDGSVPPGNPFKNYVYSYGHRNPQGLAWDNQGRLWSTEHGRSGISSGFDEVNLIEKGANYGWPAVQGDEARQGMKKPIVHSGAEETWAPGGLTYKAGMLYFGGLRGQTLYEAKINGSQLSLKAHFRQEYGRLRTTFIDPLGRLYLTTSNTDGRGTPNSGDDKIFQINTKIFD